MKNEKGYEAIIEEANRIGWPVKWNTDLGIDKEVLLCQSYREGKPAPQEFIWIIRDWGTHMYWINENQEANAQVIASLEWHKLNNPISVWYIYAQQTWSDEVRLRAVSPDRAIAWAKEKIAATMTVR